MFSFTLTVIVHKAENLIIADILTSDPYIVLTVGDKTVGRTNTVYRNHVNPSWEKKFEIPLLHTNNIFRLKVFDEDASKSDFMGQALVNLDSLKLGEQTEEKSELTQPDNVTKTKGSIFFSLLLQRNDSIVRIEKGPVVDLDRIPPEVVQIAITELDAIQATEAMRNSVLQSMLLSMHKGILYRELLRDILSDVHAMALESSIWASSTRTTLMSTQMRESCQTGSSTLLDWSSFRSSQDVPLHDTGIAFHFHANSHLPVNCILVFPNKYLLWVWVKWMRVAKDYWKGDLPDEDLPLWVSNSGRKYRTATTVSFTFGDKTVEGSASMAMDVRNEICIEHIETRSLIYRLSLEDLVSFSVTVDSLLPKKFSLKVLEISSNVDQQSTLNVESRCSISLSTEALFVTTSTVGPVAGESSQFIWSKENIFIDIDDSLNGNGKPCPKGGIHIYYFLGSTKDSRLLAHRFILFSELPGVDIPNAIEALEESLEGVSPTLIFTKIPLKIPCALSITLLHGVGLLLSSDGNQPSGLYDKMCISCSPADWCGRKIKSYKANESPSLAAHPNPNFLGHTFTLRITDQICYADFIRLEIFLLRGMSREKYGDVLIPLSDFFDLNSSNLNTGTSNYPIIYHSRQVAYCYAKEKNLGTLALRLSTNQTDPTTTPVTVNMKLQLCRLHPNSFSWHGKCVLAEDIPAKVVSEACSVAATFSGLKLQLKLPDVAETMVEQAADKSNEKRIEAVVENIGKVITSIPETKIRPVKQAKSFFSLCSCSSSEAASEVYEPVRKQNVAASEPTPTFHQVDSKPITNQMLRQREYLRNPGLVLQFCRERVSMDTDVLFIPWDQVTSVDLVTDAILSIRLQLFRYFGVDANNDPLYRRVEIELFLSNCPARGLLSLVNERIGFFSLREKVKIVLASKETNSMIRRNSLYQRVSSSTSVDEDQPPATQELSFASQLVVTLDQDSVLLEKQASLLETKFAAASQFMLASPTAGAATELQALGVEIGIIRSRICRLRIYVATLLSVNIIPKHPINEQSALEIMQRDFQMMNKIVCESEVATANNRIEYLLDMAELRLRDAALSGWNERGGNLERFLERIVNNYLIEMVGLLGKFFEGTAVVKNVKGLASKTLLILSLMRYNDRLQQLLQSALRPYNLVPNPPPKLSLFLDITTVMAWYVSIMDEEMSAKVDDVLALWRDVSKDAGGDANKYQFQLPWIPMRKFGNKGIFMTQIPEESKNILTIYAECARLKREDVSESFSSSMDKLDSKVRLGFIRAFVHLCDMYWAALKSADWTQIDDNKDVDGQLAEHLEWLCSVANDCRRIGDSGMIALPAAFGSDRSGKSNSKDGVEEATLLDQAYSSFNAAVIRSADHISCIVFKILCSDNIWLDFRAHSTWLSTGGGEMSDTLSSDTFANRVMDLQDILESRVDYLEPWAYYQVLSLCADKVVVRYLYLLKSCVKANRVFAKTGPEISQVIVDIAGIKECFRQLCKNNPATSRYEDSLLSQFRWLDHAQILVSSELSSPEFDKTLQSLRKVAQGHPEDAFGLANFASYCFRLREQVPEVDANKGRSINGEKRGSVRTPVAQEIVGGALRRSSTGSKSAGGGGANKRFSLLGMFGIHENGHEEEPKKVVTDESFSNENDIPLTSNETEASGISSWFGGRRKAMEHPIIEEMRNLYEAPTTTVALHHRSPIAKVFTKLPLPQGQTDSLKTYLIYSALPLEMKEKEASNTLISNLFHNSRTATNGIFRPGRFSIMESSLSGIGGSATHIEITKLSLPSMAFVDRKLQPYFSLAIEGKEIKTGLPTLGADACYSWNTKSCVFPVDRASLQFHDLQCTLFTKNRLFSDTKIGFVNIPLSNLDVSPIEGERFELDCSESSSAVIKVQEGGELPALTISIALHSPNGQSNSSGDTNSNFAQTQKIVADEFRAVH